MKRNIGLMVAWPLVYLLFIFGPLFALLLGAWPVSRDFFTEFSVALGYAGLAMMGLQFGLTIRFRHVTQPWGDDVIYHIHRQLSIVAVLLVIAHPVILFVVHPEFLALLNSFSAPWRARFAALSTYSLIAILITSVWRKKLRLSYEAWHVLHILLAAVAVAAGVAHMLGWCYYLTSYWKKSLWVGMSAFWIGLLLYVRVIKPLFMIRRPYVVSAVQVERGDTYTLKMLPIGHAGFRFTPGQYGWLTVWRSPLAPTAHPFVFSSSANGAGGAVEMTIRNLGDFTNTVGTIPVGRRVYIDGPYGTVAIANDSSLLVLMAAGVGIAPMMSILRTAAEQRDQRRVLLFYSNHDWDAVTFREELETLKHQINLKIVHVLTDPPEGWFGEQGHLDCGILERYLPRPYADSQFFLCGPDSFLESVEQILDEFEVPIYRYSSEPPSFV